MISELMTFYKNRDYVMILCKSNPNLRKYVKRKNWILFL